MEVKKYSTAFFSIVGVLIRLGICVFLSYIFISEILYGDNKVVNALGLIWALLACLPKAIFAIKTLKHYFILEDQVLKYYKNNNLVYEWKVDEVEFQYKSVKMYIGIEKYGTFCKVLIVKSSEETVEINCAYLNWWSLVDELKAEEVEDIPWWKKNKS